LVRTLAKLVGEEPGLTPQTAREQLAQLARFLPVEEVEDEVSLRFLNLVGEAFDAFSTNPVTEIVSGRLSAALETLARIPVIGANVSTAIAPAVGAEALREAHGPDRTWVHLTLESIRDEVVLRRLILRLLQASPSPPAYGQIRHGPLEHGTDIAVLLEEENRFLLRMYQVKCGNITTRVEGGEG
jgi:hypothetical protein